MLVLDTIAPTTLRAVFSGSQGVVHTVETTIKSTSSFPVETLRDLYRYARQTGNDKVTFVVTKAAALQAEREAAHAEALVEDARRPASTPACICGTYTRCWDHRRQDALRATTHNGALRALHRAYND